MSDLVKGGCPTCNDPVEGVVPDRLLDALDPTVPILLCCRWQSADKYFDQLIFCPADFRCMFDLKFWSIEEKHLKDDDIWTTVLIVYTSLTLIISISISISISSPIIFVVALDDSAIVVGFTTLDDLSHVAVDLKHPLLPWNIKFGQFIFTIVFLSQKFKYN